MPYYRYSIDTPSELNRFRSLTPLPAPLSDMSFFSYRCYTSEKDDSSSCNVISLGYERSWPNKTNGPRSINRFILHYVLSGKGYINGYEVSGGQCFFVKPYEEHTLVADQNDPMELYYIGISGPGTENIMKSAGFFSVPQIQVCPFIEKIPILFHKPLFEANTEEDQTLFLMGFFLQLVSLHKHYNIQSSSTPQDDTYFYYKEALVYIHDSLLEGISPKDVAQYLHISPSYLRVIFSKHCKYSLRELLIRKRIECAASHLRYDNWSVSRAAALIGYEDYTLFSKIFKKYTGISPLEYKKSPAVITIIQTDISNPLK